MSPVSFAIVRARQRDRLTCCWSSKFSVSEWVAARIALLNPLQALPSASVVKKLTVSGLSPANNCLGHAANPPLSSSSMFCSARIMAEHPSWPGHSTFSPLSRLVFPTEHSLFVWLNPMTNVSFVTFSIITSLLWLAGAKGVVPKWCVQALYFLLQHRLHCFLELNSL